MCFKYLRLIFSVPRIMQTESNDGTAAAEYMQNICVHTHRGRFYVTITITSLTTVQDVLNLLPSSVTDGKLFVFYKSLCLFKNDLLYYILKDDSFDIKHLSFFEDTVRGGAGYLTVT